MAEISIEDWLDLVSNLDIRSSRGLPAPYQPLMLMAALIDAAHSKVPRPVITKSSIASTFKQLKEDLCPLAGKPDSIRMPMGALGRAHVVAFHRAGVAPEAFATAFRSGLRGRELMLLADHVELPDEIIRFVRRSTVHLTDLLLAIANRHLETLTANGFGGLDTLRGHWMLRAIDSDRDEGQFDSEAEVEEALFDAWSFTPFAEQYGFVAKERQLCTRNGRIDILASRDSRDHLVVELKHGDPRERVVAQVCRYISTVEDMTASKSKGSRVQGAIVTDVVSDHLQAAVKGAKGVGLSLWRYDSLLRLEHVAGEAIV